MPWLGIGEQHRKERDLFISVPRWLDGPHSATTSLSGATPPCCASSPSMKKKRNWFELKSDGQKEKYPKVQRRGDGKKHTDMESEVKKDRQLNSGCESEEWEGREEMQREGCGLISYPRWIGNIFLWNIPSSEPVTKSKTIAALLPIALSFSLYQPLLNCLYHFTSIFPQQKWVNHK